MSPVAAPADKRFRRAHVKPARRRSRVRRLVKPIVVSGLLVGAVALAAVRGRELVLHAPMLAIDTIVVRGNSRLPTPQVLALVDGLRGENIVLVDLAEWQARLEASSWVRAAALRRSLPSTVEITVAEREPIGLARVGEELFLIDEQGVAIDRYGPQSGRLELPMVDGLVPEPRGRRRGSAMLTALPGTAGAPAIDDAKASLAARLIRDLQPDDAISSRLSQIDVTDPRNAAVILSDDPSVELYLGDERFLIRLQAYLALASALRERVPEIDYVDLRFEDRIYVRPADTKGRPLSLTAGRGRN